MFSALIFGIIFLDIKIHHILQSFQYDIYAYDIKQIRSAVQCLFLHIDIYMVKQNRSALQCLFLRIGKYGSSCFVICIAPVSTCITCIFSPCVKICLRVSHIISNAQHDFIYISWHSSMFTTWSCLSFPIYFPYNHTMI